MKQTISLKNIIRPLMVIPIIIIPVVGSAFFFKAADDKLKETYNTTVSTETVSLVSREQVEDRNANPEEFCVEIVLSDVGPDGKYPEYYLVYADLGEGEYEPLFMPIKFTMVYTNHFPTLQPFAEIYKNKYGNIVEAFMYLPENVHIRCSGLIAR